VKDSAWGFGWGAGTGIVLMFVALLVVDPAFEVSSDGSARTSLGLWLDLNLGYSVWLFALVLTLYVLNLRRLNQLLEGEPPPRHVVELDQLSDVWIHLFVGIGVIWTAVGMRSALQSALGDPGQALVDTAGSVLQKLVDGGILLALTTTIVGGVGGYLMRLAKTMVVGASLHDFYDEVSRHDTVELLRSTQRIEQRLERLEVTQPGGGAS
jgi:hypothetical protein